MQKGLETSTVISREILGSVCCFYKLRYEVRVFYCLRRERRCILRCQVLFCTLPHFTVYPRLCTLSQLYSRHFEPKLVSMVVSVPLL